MAPKQGDPRAVTASVYFRKVALICCYATPAIPHADVPLPNELNLGDGVSSIMANSGAPFLGTTPMEWSSVERSISRAELRRPDQGILCA